MPTPTDQHILKLLKQGYSVLGVAVKLNVTVQQVYDARGSGRRGKSEPEAEPEISHDEILRRAKAIKQESLSQTRDKK